VFEFVTLSFLLSLVGTVFWSNAPDKKAYCKIVKN